MRCAKHPPIRNKIDLSDPGQVRAWKRRLGLSTSDLQRIVEKVGNSLANWKLTTDEAHDG
jgi:hypothetical protein